MVASPLKRIERTYNRPTIYPLFVNYLIYMTLIGRIIWEI